jgi:hypothetical protein
MYISFHHIIKLCICSKKDCTCAHTFWCLWTSKLNNYSNEFSILWSSSILNGSLLIYSAKFHVKISTDSGLIPYGRHLHTLIQVVRSHVLVQMQCLNNIWTSLAKQWANLCLVLQSMSTFMTIWNVPRLDLDISHHCRECLELIGISVLSPLLFETIGP